MRTTMKLCVAALAAVAAAALQAPVAAAAPATASCPTTPTYRADVPTPESVLGFPLGLGQPQVVTTEQSDAYLLAVDAATDRVASGVLATSWGGKPLRYAIVTSPDNHGKLDQVVHDVQRLRDPRSTEASFAKNVAQKRPAIFWMAGNVHGGEKSGTDAELRVLYELAAREDCEVLDTLDRLVTVINPTQNPDGRELSRRQNLYGFDMNRDWFARTQVETDGKVEALRKLPPVVYIDAHEMGGRQYFFPPNADPIHHEIAPEVVNWINEIGEANKAAFAQHWNGACRPGVTTECYFNYDVYDLFFMGYGDTVPSAGFGAAGMTYEKGSSSPVANRVDQQFRTHWAAVRWATENKVRILEEYAGIWQQAIEEGEAGVLQPNEVLEPGNTVQFPVPDLRIRHYFFPPDRALGDVRKLVERLRRMDVDVYRLKQPLTIPNARIFGGRSATNHVVPEGTYWVPLAQAQKHWIHAILGEDPFVPFPYFYDASTWSSPLLMGLDALYTGDDLKPKGDLVLGPEGGIAGSTKSTGTYRFALDSSQAANLAFRLLGAGVPLYRDLVSGAVTLPASAAPADLAAQARELGVTLTPLASGPAGTKLRLPAIGLFQGSGVSTTAGSHGEARYLVEQGWKATYTPITSADVNGNTDAFRSVQVLIVPDGSGSTGGLSSTGQQNLRTWVGAGGTYIGLRTLGHRLARTSLLTSTTEKPRPSGYQVLGSHFRVKVDHRSPVALGRGAEDFAFNNNDVLLNPSTTGVNVLTYASGADFWFNGYAQQAGAVAGTAAVTDEPYGQGHVVLFAFNALFRAYEESGLHLVANAVLYPASGAESLPGTTNLAGATGRERAEKAKAAPREKDVHVSTWRPLQLEVAAGDRGKAEEVVGRYSDDTLVEEAGGSAFITVANPEGLDTDAHPFARALVQELLDAGVELRSAAL